MHLHSQRFSSVWTALSIVLASLIRHHGVVVAQSNGTSAAWEQSLVDAWATIDDCQPKTGMCAACGFGVAVVDLNGPNGTQMRTYTTGPGDLAAPWDTDMTWEIASITKPFTAVATLILEDEGVLNRTSTIGDFLDCNWTLAQSDVQDVTLLELIQHYSGLPAQPPDRGPTIEGNPFANYTKDRLCASLLKLNDLPTRGRYSYSNYAYGTLGYVLTLAVNKTNPPDYEDIIKEKILLPLEMNNTSVTFDVNMAAEACSRGISRGNVTIRLGPYATLQGNGALRSTLNDMSKYMLAALYVDAGLPTPIDESKYGGLPPPSDALTKLFKAMKIAHSEADRVDLACSCVSDWCEGLLCPLPNPNDEFITPGGFEGYHTGGILSWRKSGDTGGYSSRVAYSAKKGRAAIAVDTCGGCGSKGAAGSGSQRVALILMDGPPAAATTISNTSTTPPDTTGSPDFVFTGDALSHNFPSVAQVTIEVYLMSNDTATIALSSSDGAGATTTTPARNVGNGKWVIDQPIFQGTGWGGSSDPFTKLPMQRALIISADGKSAVYQDMGADTSFALLGVVNTSRASGRSLVTSFSPTSGGGTSAPFVWFCFESTFLLANALGFV